MSNADVSAAVGLAGTCGSCMIRRPAIPATTGCGRLGCRPDVGTKSMEMSHSSGITHHSIINNIPWTMATRKVIVIFLDSKDYSVVPTKWLVQNDSNNLSNSTVQFCCWPLGRVTSSEIKNALDPEPTWLKYAIKVIGGNKTYGNFKLAWHTRVEKESESEEVQIMPKRKRTIIDVSDNNSDEDLGYCITPASSSASKLPNEMNNPSTSAYQPYDHSVYQPPTQNLQSINTQNTQQQQLSNNTLNTTYGFKEDRLEKLKIIILQGQTATDLMLNRILAKIELIEANLKNTSQNINPTVYIDPNFLGYFPLKNSEELLVIENLINNETEFVLKLESFIKSIGGNCAANHVKRVMSKLFTDEYCVHISWTGRGWVKDMTKLKETKLIKIVKKVIQECSSTLFNDSQFEKEITEQLRTANTRFKSFQIRNNKLQ
ncbi:uncharacterized protein LOC112591933 [Melanaphis sacchari]|uniref:uncharacterized protein LOC112591933 n=1 Tax=Melanaphis sacchari TaxID=742174 RepID=UPI000DC1522C|nr:uncharacterized protein LOC112591933 [Melanaphis sacchari]